MDIFDKIRDWAHQKEITTKGDTKTQFLKLSEECGELARAIISNNRDELIDAIGDIVIVLTSIAYFNNTTIEYCIESSYNIIKDRKGKIENGSFVKESYKNVIKEADKIVHERSEEKERQYGPFNESIEKTARIASELTNIPISPEIVFKVLIALKLSRMAYSDKQDSLLDCIAYIGALNDYNYGK